MECPKKFTRFLCRNSYGYYLCYKDENNNIRCRVSNYHTSQIETLAAGTLDIPLDVKCEDCPCCLEKEE